MLKWNFWLKRVDIKFQSYWLTRFTKYVAKNWLEDSIQKLVGQSMCMCSCATHPLRKVKQNECSMNKSRSACEWRRGCHGDQCWLYSWCSPSPPGSPLSVGCSVRSDGLLTMSFIFCVSDAWVPWDSADPGWTGPYPSALITRQTKGVPGLQSPPKLFKLRHPKPAYLSSRLFLPAEITIKGLSQVSPSSSASWLTLALSCVTPLARWAISSWELQVKNYLFNGNCLLICWPYYISNFLIIHYNLKEIRNGP